ncbi:MAG: GNAT family protein [Gammaproteobacteria bacterium]|nr:GNAT family protein [Gammaproteobacteria bacterium]MCZ6853498.1 GNAT family protein [Gammaproteobacteria bacterium]
MNTDVLATGASVSIRKIEPGDLERLAQFEYVVSVTEPLADSQRLQEVYAETGLWLDDAGAVAIVDNATHKMVGSVQYYRSAPCIHGLEMGYIVHDPDDREKGYTGEALRLLSDYLFSTLSGVFRQQLLIAVWNTPSWKVAERCGFLREGVLRSCGFGDEDPADCFVYSRTRKDYAQELSSAMG